MSRIVLVGANHGGLAAANTILDNYPHHRLTILDSNTNISYLGCGTALWIGGQIPGPDGLFYASKEALVEKGADLRMETRVEQIDFQNKLILSVNSQGQTTTQPYDKLLLATGSAPLRPPIPGIDLEGVHCVKLFQDGHAIDSALDDPAVRSVAVIGAGYIGVEMAEALQRRGKKTLLFDVEDTCLSGYYDRWFSQDMDQVLSQNGVELHLGEAVREIRPAGGSQPPVAPENYLDGEFFDYFSDLMNPEQGSGATTPATSSPALGGNRVGALVTDSGEYPVDMVIMAIGFRPNTVLGADTLELDDHGAYKVDRHQRTSLPDVYAAGDCATIYSNALQDDTYIALASNAVRSGIVAAHNLCGTSLPSRGVQGSNGISIFGYHMVSTGLNKRAAEKAGFSVATTDFQDLQKPAFMKEENFPVKIRIHYDRNTRRILGAQLASYDDIAPTIHFFSLAIDQQMTIDDLQLVDLFFLPHFNQPYNYITMAALSAK